MAKTLSACPICESPLVITELQCTTCRAVVRSSFDTCRFCRLSSEHLGFIELFLRCEGNLSRVEKELGLSYPTVRNRLSAAVSALGFGEANESGGQSAHSTELESDFAEQRRELLDKLSRGEITSQDVAEAFKRFN